jgi:hypothetical protein
VTSELRLPPQSGGFSALLASCLLLPVLLMSLWPSAPGINILWDLANSMGYLALALYLFLFVYKDRPCRTGRCSR